MLWYMSTIPAERIVARIDPRPWSIELRGWRSYTGKIICRQTVTCGSVMRFYMHLISKHTLRSL